MNEQAPSAKGAFIQLAFIVDLLHARSHVACAHHPTNTHAHTSPGRVCCSVAQELGKVKNEGVWGFSEKPGVVVGPACSPWEGSQEREPGCWLGGETTLGCQGREEGSSV